MSLTRELNNPNSIMSRFLNKILDPVESEVMRHKWNLKLGNANTIRMTGDVNPSLVGTAFDYAFRWTLSDGFNEPDSLIGVQAARMADKRNYQSHELALRQLIDRANRVPHLRAPVSIILSWYERIFREGNYAVIDAIVTSPSASVQDTVRMLTVAVPIAEVADIQQLMNTIPSVWGTRLQKPFVLNPILPNSGYVGGADADWIIDGILYDAKCSWKSAPFTKDNFRQVLAYALLDWNDELNLRGIGWYYARQKTIVEYDLEDILPDITTKRAALKALYTAKDDTRHRINMDDLNAELNSILWKHHGDQIKSEHIRFSWEQD